MEVQGRRRGVYAVTLVVFTMTWVLLALFVIPMQQARALGSIGSIIDTEEFDASDGRAPAPIHISGDIYAIAYRGAGGAGFVKTYTIASSGAISSPQIDSLQFEATSANFPEIVQVSGTTYAIVYQGPGNDGFLVTLTIDASGIISDTLIDTEEFDPSNGESPEIMLVSGDIFAITYRGPSNDCLIVSYQISAAGVITNGAIDSLNIDSSTTDTPDIIHIANDVYAIVYEGSGSDGFVATVTISGTGDISNAVLSSYEYDTTNGEFPSVRHVSGTTYAIAYQGASGDGFLATITISDAGSITAAVIDTEEFDIADALYPNLIAIGTNIFAVAYQGTGSLGYIKTYEISNAGAITAGPLDTLNFDATNGQTPTMLNISGDVYGVFYSGTATNGFAKTLAIGTDAIEQSGYRVFANLDSTNVGSPLAALNSSATLASPGDAFRVRMLLHKTIKSIPASGETFKLQYVGKGTGTCASPVGGTPAVYTDVSAATSIAYNNNPTPTDGVALTANGSDPTHGSDTIVNQTYEEANNFTNSVAAIPGKQDGMWDFSLKDNGATVGASYCLRVIRSSGTLLDTYSYYPEIMIPGNLSVAIVDAGGIEVASPNVLLSVLGVTFTNQSTTGTLGTSSEKIRITNTTANPAWALSIAATGGSTSFWDGPGASDYDYNDPTANAQDGGDADTLGGQMTVNPSVATITPQAGCTTTGLTLGPLTSFSEGVTNSISLLSASASAGTSCYWDLTGLGITQTIPKQQPAGTYNIDMTVTLVAM